MTDVVDRPACPHCGETRMVFDAAYQPTCWTCGASLVREASPQPPLPVPGALLPPSASMYERWKAGDFVEIYRSREVQRRNLLIFVVTALCLAGFILLVLATTDLSQSPGP